MKKILALLLVFCMIFCFASCTDKGDDAAENTSDNTSDVITDISESETTSVSEEEESTDEIIIDPTEEADYAKLYGDLTSDFKKLVDFRLSEQFESDWVKNMENVDFSDTFNAIDPSLDKDHSYHWSCMIIEMPNADKGKLNSSDDFGYILCDINKDFVPELFWVRNDHSILAIFTYKNDCVVLLDAFWPRSRCYVLQDGTMCCHSSGGASDNGCDIYTLTSDGDWSANYGFSSESNRGNEDQPIDFFEYFESEKTEITEERYKELLDLYPYEHSDFWLSLPIEALD